MKKTLFSLLLVCTTLITYAQTATIALTQQPCNNDGILTATFTGLTPPLTVQWEYGGTVVTHTGVTGLSDVLTGYSGAMVFLQVTDVNNVSAYSSGFSSPPFLLSGSTTSAACPALGSATVTVTGGTAPYSYQWYDAATMAPVGGNTATVNVPGGYYSVTVTDAAGCVYSSVDSANGSFSVQSIPAFSYTVNTTQANCTNGTATVSGLSGGVSPYTYLWSNGATTSSLSGLTAGSYQVQITDAQGCTVPRSVYVSQSIAINGNVTATPATCTQNNGAMTAFGSGGTPPYTYSWSNGGTTQSITGLATGYYGLTVTDANGCFGTSGGYVSGSTPINATYAATASSCTSATGSATLSVSGGTAPYTITWNTSPVQTGLTASNLPAGNYSFHITDATGCTRNGIAVIPPVHVISAAFTAVNATCTQANGSLQVTPSGGTAPYTYSWSNGAATATASGLAAGSYSVAITDNAGCSVTKWGNVTATSPIVAGLSTTQASCIYTSDGTITAGVSGGTAPYTYTWSNGGTGASISGLATGYYSVHITDAASCTRNLYTYVGYNAAANNCYCTITGTVYEDLNNNCIKDAGEPGISNIQMHCSGMGYAYTDAGGQYSFKVPTGTYTISETVQGYYPLAACQNNNISVSVTASSGCTNTVNFANVVNPIHDMHISLWDYTYAVPGNTYTQKCIVTNDGTVPESSILAGYKNDGQLNAASFMPSVVFTGTGNWYSSGTAFPSLTEGTSQAFFIDYSVPANIPINTNLVFKDTVAYTSPVSNWLNDYSPWNNVDYFTTNTVSSYDPNFKEVSPKGSGSNGKITYADSVLEYMVHFQNTGTWQAQNIVVMDTLDNDLDWKSLRPGYSSHPCKVTMSEGGVVKFSFNNINLPAEMYNEKGSNGMFTYTIKTKKNLPLGTEFTNSAAIYFDYNPPVITNRTLNTLGSSNGINAPSGVSAAFDVFPNPAGTMAYLGVDNRYDNTVATINLYDVTGKVMLSRQVSLHAGRQVVPLDVTQLSSGVYFIHLDANGSVSTRKLVVVR